MSTPQTTSMPIDLASKDVSAMDLRSSLIGNRDLKFRVLSDTRLTLQLVDTFRESVHSLTTSTRAIGGEGNFEILQQVEENVVVIQILVSFILELKQLQMLPLEFSPDVVKPLSSSLMEFLNFHIKALASSNNMINDAHMKTIETCAISSLEILMILANLTGAGPHEYSQPLWRYILSSALTAMDSWTDTSSYFDSILQLVPLCLATFTISSTDFHLVAVLLNTLLVRLGKQCSVDSEKARDSTSLSSITTCAAQIFGFFESKSFLPGGLDMVFPLLPNIFKFLLVCIKSSDHASVLASLNLYFFLVKAQEAHQSSGELHGRVESFELIVPKATEMLIHESVSSNIKRLYLLSPTRILSNICLQYPRVTDDIRKTSLDIEIMKKLEANYVSNQTFKLFSSLKKKSNGGTKIVDFSPFLELDSTNVQEISDFLLFLSVFTSEKEEHRERVLSYGNDEKQKSQILPKLLFETVDNFRFLLLQFHLVHSVMNSQDSNNCIQGPDLPFFGNNMGIITRLLASSCFTNNFYLIRSLSRSVSLLRTFFVECNALISLIGSKPQRNSDPFIDRFDTPHHSGGLISNILFSLRDTEAGGDLMELYSRMSSPVSFMRSCRKIQMLNKSIVLGIIANFVLDFSSFRYDIVNDQEFIEHLEYIYTRATLHSVESLSGDDLEGEENILQMETIQLNVLQIIKNYMYNENQENKIEMLSYFKLSTIFDKTLIGVTNEWKNKKISAEVRQLLLKQKIVAFDILRNLTAGSPHFSEHLTEVFERDYLTSIPSLSGAPRDWTEYLIRNIVNYDLFDPNAGDGDDFKNDEVLLSRMNDGDYVSLLLAVNYIEDHRFTNMESFVGYDLPRDELLHIWLRFLKLYVNTDAEGDLDLNTRVAISNGLNSIKLLIVWIIINLTWKDDMVGYQYPSETSYRLYDTVQGGRHGGGAAAPIDTIEIDVDDTEEGKPKDSNSNQHVMSSPLQRARYLRRFGFAKALEMLNDSLTRGTKKAKDANGGNSAGRSVSPGQRFDDFVSNDLLEKVKTAQFQLQLVKVNNGTKLASEKSSYKSLPAATSGHTHRPDVNRGGEGFGYGSDEEYADAYEHSRGSDHDVSDNQSDEVRMESAAEDSEDEPWIR